MARASGGKRHPVGRPPCGARPKLQAAKRAGAAAIGDVAAREDQLPDRGAKTPEPNGRPDPDYRRLLDGYAEPGRARRLEERLQRQEAARRGWMRRWFWRLLRR